MADGLYVRRLYIDSRFRSTGTTDDFEMQLQEGVNLPAGCHCFLSEFTGVVSWSTVNRSNKTMYLQEYGTGTTYRSIQLPEGAYDSESLRIAIQDTMNVGKPAGIGTYTVTRTSSAGSSSTAALGSAAFRFYTISLSAGTFGVLPDALLENQTWYTIVWKPGGGAAYNVKEVRSTNELFNFEDGVEFKSTHVSSFVDLRSKHSIFLHSSLGNSDSLSASGLRSILGKIPVSEAYGSVIHHQSSGSPYDLTSVGPSFMQRPRFYLRDARNQPIYLAGGHWSATIIFCMA
jgi:hypothetical protein